MCGRTNGFNLEENKKAEIEVQQQSFDWFYVLIGLYA